MGAESKRKAELADAIEGKPAPELNAKKQKRAAHGSFLPESANKKFTSKRKVSKPG